MKFLYTIDGAPWSEAKEWHCKRPQTYHSCAEYIAVSHMVDPAQESLKVTLLCEGHDTPRTFTVWREMVPKFEVWEDNS